MEQNLQEYGIGNEAQQNLYGLIGYGNNRVVPRSLLLDGELLGDTDAFIAAANRLQTNGGTEDGWRGIEFALDQYPRREGAVVNVILATDEDRDNTNSSITFNTVLTKLADNRALLNAIVNARIRCSDGTRALGMDSTGIGYVADGSGDFYTCEGASAYQGSGATLSHYVNLTVQNGGAVWDLNFLRSGGHYADSFTNAILSIKIDEILSQRPIGDLVAVAQVVPNPAVAGQTITLDGTQSFHQIEGQNIVSWDWDLDNDGVYDVSGPVVSTSYPSLGDYPVRLRVTDDSDTPLVDTADVVVEVSVPPLQPTAISGGPYLFCPQNQPWRLDASNSVNPDDGLSEPGSPLDSITSYVWDLDNDLAYDDASGAQVDVTSQLSVLGVGDHIIRLRVTDNMANAFPSSGSGNLSDTSISQVSIRDESDLLCNCLPDVAARPKATKVQLTWTDTGAHQYAIYRSLAEGGPYQEIAVTDNRYSTYLDLGLELDTTYHYVVSERGTNGRDICRSRDIAVTPTARRLDPANRAPTFTSAPVTEAVEGDLYTYDVDATDPDRRDSVSFSLSVAPSGMTIDGVSGLIEWTPINAQVGQHVVTVQASDRQAAFSEQTFIITVANVNQAPTITSTPVIEASENVAYVYNVQAIDPDLGDQLTFVLSSAPSGMTIDSLTGQINWTPDSSQVGSQSVQVIVSDTNGLTASQSFSIDVVEQNLPPSVTSSPVTEGTVGQGYQYDVDASDPNAGDTVTYSLGTFPEGMSIDPASGLISWTPTETDLGLQDVVVVVSDIAGASSTQAFQINVNEQNLAPVFSTTSLPDATEDMGYSATVSATDPNAGDVVTYAIVTGPTGLMIDGVSGDINWLPLDGDVGVNSLTVRATDSGGLFADATFTLTVIPVNDTPAINSAPPLTAQSVTLYSYQVVADDPDVGDSLSYTLTQSPQGMTITNEGLIEWTPPANANASYAVSIEVADVAGATAVQSFVISVVNREPQITSVAPTALAETELYQYQLQATDDDGDTLSYQVQNAPGSLTMSQTGLVTWQTSVGDQGTYNFDFIVTDGRGGSATEAVVLIVDPRPNTAPVIQSSPVLFGTEGSEYSSQVVAQDNESDPLQYSLLVAPQGMTISTSGLVTWTPGFSNVGDHAVTIQVTDGNAQSEQTYTLTIAALPNDPPQINSSPLTTIQVETSYEYQVLATDPEGDDLTFALTQAPAGMSMSSAGLVSWTPSAAQLGSYPVEVSVADDRGNVSLQSYSLTVTEQPNTAPDITSTPATNATEASNYTYQVAATDAEGDALTYSLSTAPTGMAISSLGLVEWTPSFAQVGSHPVAVSVTDARGASTTQTFSLVVAALPNEAPVITSVPVTQTVEGEAYTYQVTATDDHGDTLTYQLTEAPSGMAISTSGLITWTALAGSHNVGVAVSDARGGTGTQSFNLIATSASGNTPPSISSSPVTQAVADSSYSYQVVAFDVDGDSLSYSLTGGPGGMTISTEGLITWNSAVEGSYLVSVSVNDGEVSVAQSYTLDVAPSALDAEPLDVVIVISPEVVTPGSDVQIQVVPQGGVGNVTVDVQLDGAALQLDNGQAIVPGLLTGSHQLQVMVSDAQDSFTETRYFSVSDPGDVDTPTAAIDESNLIDPVTALIDIQGTAADTNLANYRMYYSLADKNAWVEFHQGFNSVTNGILAQLNPTILENGTYDLLLQVNDINGNQTNASTTFVVEGDFKVGEFSITIKDLEVPMLGLPIQVNRSYDTRRKHRSMDFGYGWSVDYQAMEVTENQTLGLNWTTTNSGGFFPTYCVVPLGPHFVTVSRPDGRIDKFNVVPVNNCSTLIPPLYIDVTFEAAPGTESSLTALNTQGLRVNGSQLLDNSLIELFDPRHYTLTTKDGIQFRVDQFSGIDWVQDRGGNRITFTNNGIIHSAGKSINFIRDGQGRITEIVDPSGESIHYEYDLAGNLRRVIDREGNVVRHTYNRSHGLADIYDPLGRRLSKNIYDEDGKLIAIEDADGNRTLIDADVENRIKRITDRLGNVKVIEYDEQGNPIREVDEAGNEIYRTFDALGYLTSETDARGNTKSYVYDANGNRISETDELGNTTTRTFDAYGNVLTETNSLGQTTTYAYDINGNKIGEINALGIGSIGTADDSGNLTAITDSLGNTTSYERNEFGQATSETDPLGTRIEYAFDDNGNQTLEQAEVSDGQGGTRVLQIQREFDANGNLVRLVDAEGFEQSFVYDASGNKVSETDANGNATTYEYDAYGRNTRITYADGTSEAKELNALGWVLSETDRLGRVTEHDYDELGRRIRSVYPDGAVETRSFDSDGRLLRETDPLGNTTTYEYDAKGRRTAIVNALGGRSTFAYDAADNIVSETDELGRVTTRAYDAGNREILVTMPDGAQVAKSWDLMNRLVSETDANGNVTQYSYDAYDRLISVTNALGNTTQYEYNDTGKFGTLSFSDPAGAKTAQIDALGRRIEWRVDGVGMPVERIRPDGSVEQMEYDGNGNLTRSIDFMGQETLRDYDVFNQKIEERFADGTVVTYTYQNSKVATAIDDRGTTRYSYDLRDRVTRVDYPDGSYVAYEYDVAGNKTRVTTANGSTQYEYDALHRLTRVIDDEAGATVYIYNAASELIETQYPNGNYELRGYTANGALESVELFNEDDQLLSQSVYTLDAVGNRIAEVGVNSSSIYTYDALNQVIEAETIHAGGTDSFVFVYDAVGNRTAVTENGVTNSYSYNPLDQLISDATKQYQYDGNGNLIEITSPSVTELMAYNARGNLTSYSDGTLSEEYGYDFNGNRISKTVSGDVVAYVLDELTNNAVVIESTVNGIDLSRYVYGLGRVAESSGSQVIYHHQDGLGSTRALTDASGLLTDTYDYAAYGELLDHQGSSDNEYLFAGEQLDSGSGQYYLRARYYNPEEGRFTQVDPFQGDDQNPLTLHDYEYSGNNPILYTDPSGRIWGLFLRGAQLSRYSGMFARIRFLLRLQSRGSVKTLRALKRTKKGIWRDATRNDEVHHIIEKRLLRQLGFRNVDDTPGIVLPREVHRVYTNRWMQALPRRGQGGHMRNLSRQDVIDAAYKVYHDSPIQLKEVLLFLL
ncbi:MAG: putative Ig domain-containing protein [Pseudomonadales bacterium]|nr:putative Ig domain-containing protein [Pseudomonadales bacterium]